ncbi:hypothetical protein ABT56_08220 [Photobacterium aquae]|uniref:Flagellin n=1 Tax=Photobacterium aquae TaxID=1195763 RepID=A0A0J1H494_9GAMM|nr:hypothetical protein [Photobacterium aquae]KLV06603.1 hypothetical protein ABT56_08220 [Photobacterium aquae]
MVNHINSSTGTLRSGDSTQLGRVASQQPVAPLSRVVEKKEDSARRQGAGNQHTSSMLVQTSRAHRQAAQAESAMQALKEANSLLGQLRNMARRSLNAQENKKDQLQQSLHQLKGKLVRLTREASYGGEAVLHHDLTPKLDGDTQTEQFSIKGMRLNTMRQQDEILRFQFEEGQPSSVRAKIESHHSTDEIAVVLDKAFAPRDIKVGVDRYGDLSFTAPKEAWPEIRRGVWMSGGGQVLPSGSPVKAKVENRDKGQVEPQQLEFGKPQSTRKALADIDRMMQKVAQSLAQIEKQQQAVVQQLEEVSRSITAKSGVINSDGSIEASWLQAPEDVSLLLIDNAVPTLLAQANATRHNVVALLEPAV